MTQIPQPADLPVERTDANSRLVHSQLVAKARQGRIDVYFVGDSITRRWGTSDEAYRQFLQNWNENFYGWNAGNFGWGGDTTQNILWRLAHGELDGVDPKVVVILAGTNNVGSGSDPTDIARGIEAIVDLCRRKAPNAIVVLTAIFPRTDVPDANRKIATVNERIQTVCDGKRVRFLNVNDRLADSNGRLYEGMTVDGLHLALKGYQVWADGLKPILREILGPPAEVDLAPPPTGDPSANRTGS